MTQNNQNFDAPQGALRKAVAAQIERKFNMTPLSFDGKDGKCRVLFAPSNSIKAIEAAEVDTTFRDDDIGFVAPENPPRARTFKPRKYLPFKRCIRVFDLAEIAHAKTMLKNVEKDVRLRLEPTIKNAENHAGYRSIPDFKSIKNDVSTLRQPFYNFEAVMNHYSGEMAVAGVGKPDNFRVTPVLLDGEPGVGKTAFAMAFADKLGLPFLKLSAGGMQHAAALVGTSQHWSNSQPGGVFNLLSKSDSAAAVLLIDEADKLSDRQDVSILPALLELLEPESSKQYRDESLRLTFDASRLIVLMTSNSTKSMDTALLSRCQIFTIGLPNAEQKLLVAKEAHDKTNKSMPTRSRQDLDMEALQKLAESDIDIRTLLMSIRNGWARAIEDGSKIVVPELPRKAEKKCQIGFMKNN